MAADLLYKSVPGLCLIISRAARYLPNPAQNKIPSLCVYYNLYDFKSLWLVNLRFYILLITRFGDLLDFGQLLKPLATTNLPQSHQFLGNFCKVVKIIKFSSETIFGQLIWTFGDFYLVTLITMANQFEVFICTLSHYGS